MLTAVGRRWCGAIVDTKDNCVDSSVSVLGVCSKHERLRWLVNVRRQGLDPTNLSGRVLGVTR